jgi:hypothetical protein
MRNNALGAGGVFWEFGARRTFHLDQNLSPKPIRKLADIFPGLESVYDHDLTGSSDPFIFEWARSEFTALVSTDRDFVDLAVPDNRTASPARGGSNLFFPGIESSRPAAEPIRGPTMAQR